MTDTEQALEILKALILPRKAETEAEKVALETAAELQAAYMQDAGEGLASLSEGNDGVSISRTYTLQAFGVCRAARAVLRNAGLLASGLPVGRAL